MSKTLRTHPRVLDYDDNLGESHIVTLKRGWAFYDAAGPGEDPEGRSACHVRAEDTVKEMLEAIRFAEPCHCGRCIGPENKA